MFWENSCQNRFDTRCEFLFGTSLMNDEINWGECMIPVLGLNRFGIDGGEHIVGLLFWIGDGVSQRFRWPWVMSLVKWLNCSWIRGCKLGRKFLLLLFVSLWGRSWGFYSVLTLASNLFKNFYDYSLCRPMWFEVRGILDGLCLRILSSVKLSFGWFMSAYAFLQAFCQSRYPRSLDLIRLSIKLITENGNRWLSIPFEIDFIWVWQFNWS